LFLLDDFFGGHQSRVGELGEQRLRECGDHSVYFVGRVAGRLVLCHLLAQVVRVQKPDTLVAVAQLASAADSAPGRPGQRAIRIDLQLRVVCRPHGLASHTS
jgi:hypothetical protein